MSKHAYLILAHKNLNQLKILLKLLDYADNDIYVHIDAKVKDFSWEPLQSICSKSNVYFLESRRDIRWGGVSMMLAELDLLDAASSKNQYEYYHLLSGQDLPIKSQKEIHHFFELNKGKEFVSFWKFKKTTPSRFKYYTLFPEGENKFVTRILNHAFKALQIIIGYRINRGITFYFGSQWFSITHSLAKYVISQREWLIKIFKNTSTCDEIFMQTLVGNSRFKNNLYVPEIASSQKEFNLSNMRLIDWNRGESIRHPWTFKIIDLEMLKKAPHLWARKFDVDIDSKIIESLESYIFRNY